MSLVTSALTRIPKSIAAVLQQPLAPNGLSLLAGIAEGYRLRRRKPLGIQALRNPIRSDIGVRVSQEKGEEHYGDKTECGAFAGLMQ